MVLISPSTFPDIKRKETPQLIKAGASIHSLVETGRVERYLKHELVAVVITVPAPLNTNSAWSLPAESWQAPGTRLCAWQSIGDGRKPRRRLQ